MNPVITRTASRRGIAAGAADAWEAGFEAETVVERGLIAEIKHLFGVDAGSEGIGKPGVFGVAGTEVCVGEAKRGDVGGATGNAARPSEAGVEGPRERVAIRGRAAEAGKGIEVAAFAGFSGEGVLGDDVGSGVAGVRAGIGPGERKGPAATVEGLIGEGRGLCRRPSFWRVGPASGA